MTTVFKVIMVASEKYEPNTSISRIYSTKEKALKDAKEWKTEFYSKNTYTNKIFGIIKEIELDTQKEVSREVLFTAYPYDEQRASNEA